MSHVLLSLSLLPTAHSPCSEPSHLCPWLPVLALGPLWAGLESWLCSVLGTRSTAERGTTDSRYWYYSLYQRAPASEMQTFTQEKAVAASNTPSLSHPQGKRNLVGPSHAHF